MKVIQKYLILGLLMFSLTIDSFDSTKPVDPKLIEKLTQAIKRNNIDMVKELLQGVDKDDLNDLDRSGQVLFTAFFENHYDMMKLVLQAGANPDVLEMVGERSVLQLAVERGYVEIVRLLLEFDANPNIVNHVTGQSVLQKAVEKNQFAIVKLLLEAGADINRADKDGKFILEIAFQKAAYHSRYDIMKLLLEFQANPNISNHLGEWILNTAVKLGKIEAVKLLLEFGADPQNRDRETDFAALHIAAQNNDSKIMELLLKNYQADPNIRTFEGATPLYFIVGQGFPNHIHANEECFDLLIKYKADLTATIFADGYTLLHILAKYYNQNWLRFMKKLIKAGVNVNTQAAPGWTALHLLARSNQPHRFDVAQELIHNDANPEIKDKAGKTPLDSISPRNPDKEKLIQLFESYSAGNRDREANKDNKKVNFTL